MRPLHTIIPSTITQKTSWSEPRFALQVGRREENNRVNKTK
jgi:hypothetical protein